MRADHKKSLARDSASRVKLEKTIDPVKNPAGKMLPSRNLIESTVSFRAHFQEVYGGDHLQWKSVKEHFVRRKALSTLESAHSRLHLSTF